MELWNKISKASCWVFGCVFCMEARQRSTVATCSCHIGTRLAEARLNEHKVLHCPCKSSWSASQKHGDEWFQPNWLLLHPPMSSCVHDMMWTNVFSRFESIYSTNVHGFLDMRICYHLWVDLHSTSPQISKSNQPNLSFKLYQIVGVSWFSWLNNPPGKSSSTGNSISGICFRKI